MVPYPYYGNHFFVFLSFTRHVFNMQWWPWAAICSETWRTLSLQVDLSNSLWIFFVHCRAQRRLQPVARLWHWFAGHQPPSTTSRIKTHVTAVCFFGRQGGWQAWFLWRCYSHELSCVVTPCPISGLPTVWRHIFGSTHLTQNPGQVGTKIVPATRFCHLVKSLRTQVVLNLRGHIEWGRLLPIRFHSVHSFLFLFSHAHTQTHRLLFSLHIFWLFLITGIIYYHSKTFYAQYCIEPSQRYETFKFH